MKERLWTSRAALLALGLCAIACDDALAESQRIEDTRVLAAQVRVEGREREAWPAASEDVALELLVAAPEPSPRLGWALSICPGAPTSRGIPECESAPFAQFASEAVGTSPPAVTFTTPDAQSLGDVDRLVVRGIVCADAQPELREPFERSLCAGESTLVAFDVTLRRELGNQNPTLRDEPFTFDGIDWPEPPGEWLTRGDCSEADVSPSLVRVTADGAKHRITTRIGDDDREVVTGVSGRPVEELWVSHFSTSGKLDRPLTAIDVEQQNLEVSLDWQSPRAVAAGQVVRFYFVLRDLRGGTDWTVRTACVLP